MSNQNNSQTLEQSLEDAKRAAQSLTEEDTSFKTISEEIDGDDEIAAILSDLEFDE